ncbi:MAG: hypothetical protein IKU20_01905 [Lachnospiraceae bacterium]|nr:hypothetical protein [Lachnospiraceae bacterium]
MGRTNPDMEYQRTREKKISDLSCRADGRLKDSYEYIKDCLEELDNKTPKNVFSWVIEQKLQWIAKIDENGQPVNPKVEDYIDYVAQCLASYCDELEKWTQGDEWHLPVVACEDGTYQTDKKSIYTMWKKTVYNWWNKRSFPNLQDKSYLCGERDIVLYFLFIMGFTVEESDQFLEEMCLVNGSSDVRPLYALDFKECVFRWIMLWNEKHERKISYKEACSYYQEYGVWLISKMQDLIVSTRNKCKQSDALKNEAESLVHCSEILNKIMHEENGLFKKNNAEALKRITPLIRHIEKKVERITNPPDFKVIKGHEQVFQEIRYYNENTRVEKGTQFAWSELSRLACTTQEPFAECFEIFKEKSWTHLGDMYWRQFSDLVQLFTGNAGKALDQQKLVSAKDDIAYKIEDVMNALEEMAILDLSGKCLSIAYNGDEIRKILEKYTDIFTRISKLLKPIRRQDVGAETVVDRGNSSGLSQMFSAYHAWCYGVLEDSEEKKKPKNFLSEFGRKNVLKKALAAGVEDLNAMNEALELTGNAEFQLLNREEALVYSILSYVDLLACLYDSVKSSIVNSDINGKTPDDRKKIINRLSNKLLEVPKEMRIELSPEITDAKWYKNDQTRATAKLWAEKLKQWWNSVVDEQMEIKRLSAIEMIRMADFLTILQKTENGDADELEEIRKLLFYGPYTDDFKAPEDKIRTNKTGVKEQTDWLCVVSGLYRMMKQIFTKDGIKLLFSFAYCMPSETLISEVIRFASPENVNCSGKNKQYKLAEPYLNMVLKNLEDLLKEREEKELIKTSEAETQKLMDQFVKIVKQSSFMNQPFPVIEARYILEQWASVLAVLKYYDINVNHASHEFNIQLNIWEQGVRTLQLEEKLNKLTEALFHKEARKWIRELKLPKNMQLDNIWITGDEDGFEFCSSYCEEISEYILAELDEWEQKEEEKVRKRAEKSNKNLKWSGVMKANIQEREVLLNEFVHFCSCWFPERQIRKSKKVQGILEKWGYIIVVLERYQQEFPRAKEFLGKKMVSWLTAIDACGDSDIDISK